MKFRSAASCAALLVVGATTGCGGSEFAAGPGDADADVEAGPVVSAVQACGDNAKARCMRTAECSEAFVATTYIDEGTCETRLKLSCLNALSAADTGGTPEASEACAAAYPTESCDDLLDDTPPAVCLQARGSRANGATCGFPGQCQTGFCAIVPGSQCGTCAPLPQEGDSCLELTTCGQLLSCWIATALCTSFAPQGAVCNKGQPCGGALFCVGSTSTTNGVCEPSIETLNAACDSQAKTGPGCDRNALLTCNGASNQCATIQFASAGQPCGTVNKQLSLCSAAGTCTTLADAGAAPTDGGSLVTEVCVAAAADGAECDLDVGPGCVTPARCVASVAGGRYGTCQFADPSKCQ
jgi:hypothetical protein